MSNHRSPSSNASRRRSNSDTSSQTSSSSTDASSTSPPLNHTPIWHKSTNSNYDYPLPCEFGYLGCGIVYHPERWESWMDHTISHFADGIPPPKAVCIFCDGPGGTFEDSNDPERNWFYRMIHIGKHHMEHAIGMRPDYFVLKHLHSSGRLEEDHFQQVWKYTERKNKIDNLVSYNHKPDRVRVMESRQLQEKDDLQKEFRELRKMLKEKQRLRNLSA